LAGKHFAMKIFTGGGVLLWVISCHEARHVNITTLSLIMLLIQLQTLNLPFQNVPWQIKYAWLISGSVAIVVSIYSAIIVHYLSTGRLLIFSWCLVFYVDKNSPSFIWMFMTLSGPVQLIALPSQCFFHNCLIINGPVFMMAPKYNLLTNCIVSEFEWVYVTVETGVAFNLSWIRL
jgi:hypothetical protein